MVTSHKEPRQTYRGRRKTTTLPLNGRLHRKRNHLQWKPSFAIKSDKKALLTPKGDHIPKEDREGTRWKPPTPTRSREEEPRAKEQDRPVRRDSHPDQRMLKHTASASGRGPRTKANSQRRESKCHDRGLRKNTVPT